MANEVEDVTNDAIKRGGILAKLYLDMQSEKEEDLQPLMTDLINNRLLKTPGVLYCAGMIEAPMKVEEGYTTSAAVTTLFKDLGALINVTFNFAPAGIEILRPKDDYTIKTSQLQSLLIDLSGISINYSQYILSKVLSKEEFAKIEKDLHNREALGKRMIDKKDGLWDKSHP